MAKTLVEKIIYELNILRSVHSNFELEMTVAEIVNLEKEIEILEECVDKLENIK